MEGREREKDMGKKIFFSAGSMFKGNLEGTESYIQSCFESNGIIGISQKRKLKTRNEEGFYLVT